MEVLLNFVEVLLNFVLRGFLLGTVVDERQHLCCS